MGENMTAFHWLLGWYIVLTIVSGALLARAMMAKDSTWHAGQSSRR